MSGKRLTRYITVRWTEDQYEQVMREVERKRTTPSRFIRARVLRTEEPATSRGSEPAS